MEDVAGGHHSHQDKSLDVLRGEVNKVQIKLVPFVQFYIAVRDLLFWKSPTRTILLLLIFLMGTGSYPIFFTVLSACVFIVLQRVKVNKICDSTTMTTEQKKEYLTSVYREFFQTPHIQLRDELEIVQHLTQDIGFLIREYKRVVVQSFLFWIPVLVAILVAFWFTFSPFEYRTLLYVIENVYTATLVLAVVLGKTMSSKPKAGLIPKSRSISSFFFDILIVQVSPPSGNEVDPRPEPNPDYPANISPSTPVSNDRDSLHDSLREDPRLSEGENRRSIANCDKSGYLTKQGASVKNWKRRFFVLSGDKLTYSKTDKDVSQLGLIDLSNCMEAEPYDSEKKQHCFIINNVATGRDYKISADSVEHRDEWIQAINCAIAPHASRLSRPISTLSNPHVVPEVTPSDPESAGPVESDPLPPPSPSPSVVEVPEPSAPVPELPVVKEEPPLIKRFELSEIKNKTASELQALGPLHSGMLSKRGHLVHNWRNRFFLLIGPHLFYFASSTARQAKGVIDLENFQLDSLPMDQNLEFKLSDRSSHYELSMRAHSESEKQVWIQILTQTLDSFLKPDLHSNTVRPSISSRPSSLTRSTSETQNESPVDQTLSSSSSSPSSPSSSAVVDNAAPSHHKPALSATWKATVPDPRVINPIAKQKSFRNLAAQGETSSSSSWSPYISDDSDDDDDDDDVSQKTLTRSTQKTPLASPSTDPIEKKEETVPQQTPIVLEEIKHVDPVEEVASLPESLSSSSGSLSSSSGSLSSSTGSNTSKEVEEEWKYTPPPIPSDADLIPTIGAIQREIERVGKTELNVFMNQFEDAEVSGYMMKLGKEKISIKKRWRKRFFVLTNCRIYYFKNASEVARGVIYLGGQVCYMESKNNVSTFFINDFIQNRTFVLDAMSDATRVKWVRETEHLSQRLKSQGMEPLLESLRSLNPLSDQERDSDFVDLRPSSQVLGSSLSAHQSENLVSSPASSLSSSAPPASPKKIAATEVSMIHKQGFLLKRGDKIKSWKRRYFILNDQYLYYYANPKDKNFTGAILLKNCLPPSVTLDVDDHKFCFSLREEVHNRDYIISCANSIERLEWIVGLQKMIAKVAAPRASDILNSFSLPDDQDNGHNSKKAKRNSSITFGSGSGSEFISTSSSTSSSSSSAESETGVSSSFSPSSNVSSSGDPAKTSWRFSRSQTSAQNRQSQAGDHEKPRFSRDLFKQTASEAPAPTFRIVPTSPAGFVFMKKKALIATWSYNWLQIRDGKLFVSDSAKLPISSHKVPVSEFNLAPYDPQSSDRAFQVCVKLDRQKYILGFHSQLERDRWVKWLSESPQSEDEKQETTKEAPGIWADFEDDD